MQATLEIVLPVFGLVLCGWAVAKTPLLSPEGIRGLNNFVFWVAIPALLFRSMSTLEVPDTVDAEIIPAYFLSCGIVYGLGLLIGRGALKLKLDEAAIFGMGAAFGNLVLLGVPLVLLAFGERGLLAMLLIISFHPLILITVPTIVIEIGRGHGSNTGEVLWAAGRGLLRNPVILSIAAGLIWRQTGLGLWRPLETFIDLLKAGAAPAALFAVGASIATFRIAGNVRQSLLMVGLKLVVLPPVVWAMTALVFRIDPLWVAVATVTASMPVGVNVYLLAAAYKTYVARAATAVLVGTALSVLTTGTLIALLAPGAAGR